MLYPGSVRIVIKPSIFALSVVFALSSLFAQKPGWQPSSGHTQIPIWPGSVPDAQFGPPPNTEMVPEPGEVDNVSRPTMMVYPPTGKNTGAAVVVFPGGGYYVLAIDLEGTHLYAEGKHAFGLRRTKFPITRGPQLVETWLRTIGMVSE